MWNIRGFVAIAGIVLASASGAQALYMETKAVGNPGNAPDTRYATPGYGGVDYVYNIGRCEVSAGQYTEFLNKVAATDTYGLYNTNMWSNSFGCKIERSGSPGSYTYSVALEWADRPVNYVSWYDSLRFANWMHNGQPSGPQGPTTTEDGSYDMTQDFSDPDSPTRNSDATWVLPTEDEWYKAAYHKNDCVTGHYWDYPTSTNSVPSNALIAPDPGNNANFYDSGYTTGSPYYRTEVGEFENSESPYGTFDQGGNVLEWNEARISSSRGLRGGSLSSNEGIDLRASFRNEAHPTFETHYVGFRIAAMTSPDCNANGVPDECDIADMTSQDCNANGVPDECDEDLNTNGIPDDCEEVHNVTRDTYHGTIQLAIGQALTGNEIVVAPGNHAEAINFLGKAITLRSSDGPGVTTIDATGLNTSVVKCINGEGPNTVLEGFTITGGTGTDLGGETYGGGMYNNSASPTVINCAFSGNSATQDGGGMYINNGSPILTNCRFSGNTSQWGAGMYNMRSNSAVINCTFSGNTASATGSGMLNQAYGGTQSFPTITNCILWGDTNNEIINLSGSVATVTYSDVQGGYAGAGNIDADPLFVDADGPDNTLGTEDDNLRLRPGSPCADAGDNTAVPAGITTDLDGNARFVDMPPPGGSGNPPGADAFVDMGAYELSPKAPADFDYDGDVDAGDYDRFEACASGPGVPLTAGCEDKDFDDDGDVDQSDFAVFQRCFSGGGNPADANCMN